MKNDQIYICIDCNKEINFQDGPLAATCAEGHKLSRFLTGDTKERPLWKGIALGFCGSLILLVLIPLAPAALGFPGTSSGFAVGTAAVIAIASFRFLADASRWSKAGGPIRKLAKFAAGNGFGALAALLIWGAAVFSRLSH